MCVHRLVIGLSRNVQCWLLLLNSCAVHQTELARTGGSGSSSDRLPGTFAVVSLCRFFISFTLPRVCARLYILLVLFGHILFNYGRLDVENWAKVCQTFIKLCIRIMLCLILLFTRQTFSPIIIMESTVRAQLTRYYYYYYYYCCCCCCCYYHSSLPYIFIVSIFVRKQLHF